MGYRELVCGLVSRYRELVGCLVYLTTARSEIAYAVHICSQFVLARRSTR